MGVWKIVICTFSLSTLRGGRSEPKNFEKSFSHARHPQIQPIEILGGR